MIEVVSFLLTRPIISVREKDMAFAPIDLLFGLLDAVINQGHLLFYLSSKRF